MDELETLAVRVVRDGPRGWHWISKEKFDPNVHVLYEPKAHQDAAPDSVGLAPADKPRSKPGPKPKAHQDAAQ